MVVSKRSVLITGSSDGGTGAALAKAFHNAGYKVYATARSVKKTEKLAALGIETLELDVLSESSISACVGKLDSLDILVNNAGAQLTSSVSDVSIAKAKELFDINCFAHIQVIQAFLPLLLKSDNGLIVNHTSSASVISIPFQSTYNASKAAMAAYSGTLRLELQPFGIKVVDLRSGIVKSNIFNNLRETKKPTLPEDSIYSPAKQIVDKILTQDEFSEQGIPASEWARGVVSDLTKRNPPPQIWRGESAWLVWLSTKLPFGMFDGVLKKAVGFDKVESILRK